ncbi:heavy metal sensor histidine kinase [Variovorax sp. RHLX14]|uniref:heavy metal sensor histidine kinase n=1 Tax=Variovorax sp. RHLX14 TaxID=1259731 RepID=UPI003F4587B1
MRKVSITTRLTLLFAGTSATVLLGLGILISKSLDAHFASEDYSALEERIELIQKTSNESTPEALPIKLDTALKNYPGFIAQVTSRENGIVYSTENFDFAMPLEIAKENQRFAWTEGGQKYRGVVHRTQTDANVAGELSILVGLSTSIHEHFMESFTHTLIAFVLGATVLCGLLGWWAARRGLEPLRTMSGRARTVTGSQLHERMPVDSVPVEIADLANTLNAMLERLQSDFKRLSDFSSDIAHELRTPITNMMTQTHVTLNQARTNEKYRDIMASNAEEMQRLARMIADMLYLAKTENGLNLPSSEDVDLAKEIEALFEFYEALAEDKTVTLTTKGGSSICGDKLMIRRAISNVLSNALRHAFPHTSIDVEIINNNLRSIVNITNTGNTIPVDQAAFIFDRFFRADKSRTRPDSDGVGLGLSITKAIMAAHNGTIEVSSNNERTTFTLTFG